jgi:integrase/recombinase XerD
MTTHRSAKCRHIGKRFFVFHATNWLRLLGRFEELPAPQPFGGKLDAFVAFLVGDRGLSPSTIRHYRRCIGEFLTWVDSHEKELSAIALEDVSAFIRALSSRRLKRTTIALYVAKLRNFFRFAEPKGWCRSGLSALDAPRIYSVKPEKFQPYIYTNRDMKQLIDATDSRHRDVWLLEPDTVRTLLLLLYGSGLRLNEALRLRTADFDADAGVLTIRETKFFKSRFVPVGPDLARVLRDYIRRQWSGRTRTDATPLLGTHKGEPILRQTAELVFKRLREEAGVLRSKDARYQPRLHDLRHTFAVVRLVTWYREGKNVQRLLPHLSIHLGHARLRDTQRYLTMTTALLQRASRCFEQYARPEVTHV